MGLHLLAVDGLNVADFVLYPLNHVRTERAVVGQEVEEAHRAGFADVEIGQPLGRGAGVIAAPLFVIERGAEMQAVGRWGGSMDQRGGGENESEQGEKGGAKNWGIGSGPVCKRLH